MRCESESEVLLLCKSEKDSWFSNAILGWNIREIMFLNVLVLILEESKCDAIRNPKDLITLGFLSLYSENCGGNVTSKASYKD